MNQIRYGDVPRASKKRKSFQSCAKRCYCFVFYHFIKHYVFLTISFFTEVRFAIFWQTNIKLDWTICVIVNRNNFALTNVFCVYFERSMQHWCVLCVAVSFYLLNFYCFCYICMLCFWSCLYVCLCVYLCVCIYVSVSRITAKTNYRFHWNLLLWIGLPYGLTFDDGAVPDTDSVSHFHFHQHCRKEISWFVSISHTVTGRLSRNSAKWLTPIRELVNKILGWIWWTPESRSI